MNSRIKSLLQFVYELRRRRVFRGIIAYGATTLVILEATQIICEAFGIDRVPLWVLIILGAGFIGSLWFSWLFDFTSEGIVRTKPQPDQRVLFREKKSGRYRMGMYVSLSLIVLILSYNMVEAIRAKRIKAIEKSMVVLAPVTIGGQEDRDSLYYIGKLITDALARVEAFNVVSWDISRYYDRQMKSPGLICRDLNVSLIIDWKPVNSGNAKYIDLCLVSSDGKIMFREKYGTGGGWSDISLLTSGITRDVARNLRTVLTPLERAEIARQVPSTLGAGYFAYRGGVLTQEAIDLFHRGNRHTKLSSLPAAIELYTRAIEIEPDFAEAYANRAKTRLWAIKTNSLGNDELGKCKDDINAAVKINPGLVDAKIALAFYYYYGLDDLESARVAFEEALLLKPDDCDCNFYLSLIYRRLGLWERVSEIIDKLIMTDPHSSLIMTNIGLSYNYLHRFGDAVLCHDRAIELQPEWSAPYKNKIESLLLLNGNVGEARLVINEALVNTGKSLYKQRALIEMYDDNAKLALDCINLAEKNEFVDQGEEYLLKGRINGLAGNAEMSEQYYYKAVDYYSGKLMFDPSDARSYTKLGIAYAASGSNELAISTGLKALAISMPDNDYISRADRMVDMLMIYAMTGEYHEGINLLKKLLSDNSCFSLGMVSLDPCLRELVSHDNYEEVAFFYRKPFINDQLY